MNTFLSERFEAKIELVVGGKNSAVVDVECVIDTGFTDEITLPMSLISALGLSRVDSVCIRLADGSTQFVDVYGGRVQWFGEWRPVFVQRSEADPLLGVAMMMGHDLAISFTEGGSVALELAE